jgi:hypothetical protein
MKGVQGEHFSQRAQFEETHIPQKNDAFEKSNMAGVREPRGFGMKRAWRVKCDHTGSYEVLVLVFNPGAK